MLLIKLMNQIKKTLLKYLTQKLMKLYPLSKIQALKVLQKLLKKNTKKKSLKNNNTSLRRQLLLLKLQLKLSPILLKKPFKSSMMLMTQHTEMNYSKNS
jgi:hypothetical protein